MAERFKPLQESLKQGRVLLPGDEDYTSSLARWSATCVKPAAAVAQPQTAEEVSAVVQFATSNKIAFNVCGGGHSTSQSSSAPSPDGMVLDLKRMRAVSVDASAQTVTFDGGCTWKDVDEALWAHGLATVGGTVSHTGVGGLVIHGGFGVLSGLHGLSSDVLLSCRVVLADGRIVEASATENEDLFWAVRGAGSSFGVVVQFTSKAFPQGTVWGGMGMYTMDKLPTLVDFINKWADDNDGTQCLSMGFTYAPPTPGSAPDAPRPPVITLQVIHVGENAEVDGPAYFAPLMDLEAIMKQVDVMPYPKVNQGGDDTFFPAGNRYLLGAGNFTTPLDLSAAQSICDKFLAFAKEHPDADAESSICILEAFPHGKKRSFDPSATAFNSRGDYYNVLFAWAWTNPSADTAVRAYNRSLVRESRSLGYNDTQNKDGVGRYINYESSDINADDAFGDHAARLKKIKAIYDPTNVFNKIWKL